MLEGLRDMVDKLKADRVRDAGRFAALDWQSCQLCGARGGDKRNLVVDCFYDLKEVVPEMIRLDDVSDPRFAQRGYLLRVCKACRGDFIGLLGTWREQCVKRRGVEKSPDGRPLEEDPERNIPVRVNGATVMMTEEEWRSHTAKSS